MKTPGKDNHPPTQLAKIFSLGSIGCQG